MINFRNVVLNVKHVEKSRFGHAISTVKYLMVIFHLLVIISIQKSIGLLVFVHYMEQSPVQSTRFRHDAGLLAPSLGFLTTVH